MPPLEERTEYPYQNIRVKNYPWGDGDKVSVIPDILCFNSLTCANTMSDHLVSFSHRPNQT